MAEVGAVAPVHTRLVGDEGHRGRLQRVNDEIDVVFGNRKAVCQVFDLVQIGQDQRDLVTLLDIELTQAEGRCLRGELDGDLLALAGNTAVLGVADGRWEVVV